MNPPMNIQIRNPDNHNLHISLLHVITADGQYDPISWYRPVGTRVGIYVIFHIHEWRTPCSLHTGGQPPDQLSHRPWTLFSLMTKDTHLIYYVHMKVLLPPSSKIMTCSHASLIQNSVCILDPRQAAKWWIFLLWTTWKILKCLVFNLMYDGILNEQINQVLTMRP